MIDKPARPPPWFPVLLLVDRENCIVIEEVNLRCLLSFDWFDTHLPFQQYGQSFVPCFPVPRHDGHFPVPLHRGHLDRL